jgi:DNA-binding NarL/FixJ family response regulator
MPDSDITCVIVDDHEIVTEGIVARLNAFADVVVVGTAHTGDAGLKLIAKQQPDIARVDYRLPGIDGLRLVELSTEQSLRTRHIMFSAATGHRMIDRAFGVGACGYISKMSPAFTVEHAIRIVAAGGHYVDPTIAAAMLKPTDELSDREEQVLMLLGEGLSNKMIADRMGLTAETVKSHVAKVMSKLEATNRTEVVIKAFRAALIT